MEATTEASVSATSELLRDAVQSMHGLDFLQAIIAGDLPEPPLLQALEVRTVAATAGEVVLRTVPRPQHFNTIGTAHGGFISTLLDAALGSAIDSVTPAGTLWTTMDLHVRFRRAMTAESGEITATGRVDHHGRSTAHTSGEVRDAQGRVLATATASLFPLRG